MFISVLIPTYNRAEDLRQTLHSLFSSPNVQSLDWEVIVVDNASVDHTPEVCRGFGEKFPQQFRYLFEGKRGKSHALNTAIVAAKGDILAFTDDDVLCAPDYFQGIRSVFEQYAVDGVQGRVLLECEGGRPEWLDDFLGLTLGWRDCGDQVFPLDKAYSGCRTLFGGNMIVRADVLQKIGGFAPELGPGVIGLGEETELSLRMLRAGCRLIYAPQVVIRFSLSRQQLTKSLIRNRFFQQGRAYAYSDPLPVPLWRFGLYVVKESLVAEVQARWHSWAGRPALALRRQCEARSQAGFFWQYWLFRRGAPSQLSTNLPSSSGETSLLSSASRR